MKFKFKKIASILAGTVLMSSSLAFAAAANYPAPFVNNGSADVAVVYGSMPGAEFDLLAVSDITASLQAKLAAQTAKSGTGSSGSSATGGDSFKLEKTSTKFHLGDSVLDVVSGTVSDDDLPTLLADQVFSDNDNDEFDYTQEVNMGNHTFTMFEDNDYKSDNPSLGIKIASGAYVLNYTLDFTDNPDWADLETSDLTVLGKTYYILDTTTNTSLTLLDAAESSTISEGETKSLTVNGKKFDVKINFIGDNKIKLDVNGEVTNQLSTTTNTYKLSDGTYVGIKEINYNSKDTGVSNVEFSLGSGKLILEDGSDIELNDETINGLSTNLISSAEQLQQIDIVWTADEDLFVANDSSPTMPGFEAVKLSYGGVTHPATEMIAVEAEGDSSFVLKDFPLKDSTETINLLFSNGSQFTGIGKDSTNRLVTSGAARLDFDADTDSYFVASWSDGTDAESYLVKADSFKTEDSVNKTTISYKSDGTWKTAKTDAQDGDTISIGNVDLRIGVIDRGNKKVQINTTSSSANFNVLYSDEGLRVYLPFVANATSGVPGQINLTAAAVPDTFSLVFSEEDKNENKGAGSNITLTLNENSDLDTSVTTVAYSPSAKAGTSTEIGDSDIERNFAYSALATEVWFDKGPDQQKVTLVYHGDESYGNFYLTAPSTTVTGPSGPTGTVKELGSVSYTDANVPANANLIVVGGSCVNKVAAELLGVSAGSCGAAWEQKTGAGAGSFLIQSFDRSGKVATLVAGYNAEDTRNAAKVLTSSTIDTAAGKKYKSTSATAVELQTTTA